MQGGVRVSGAEEQKGLPWCRGQCVNRFHEFTARLLPRGLDQGIVLLTILDILLSRPLRQNAVAPKNHCPESRPSMNWVVWPGFLISMTWFKVLGAVP